LQLSRTYCVEHNVDNPVRRPFYERSSCLIHDCRHLVFATMLAVLIGWLPMVG